MNPHRDPRRGSEKAQTGAFRVVATALGHRSNRLRRLAPAPRAVSGEESQRPEMDEEVRSLLERHVDSFEGLEALLLLRRQHGAPMSLDAVRGGIRIPTPDLERALARLQRGGLVSVRREANTDGYVYAPKTSKLAASVERLAALYADSPVEIARMLTERALDRVRSEAAQLFADAFVLGRKKDG